jgi:mRNA interferase HicA
MAPVLMTQDEFVRRVRKLGRKKGVPVSFEARKGKGSHGVLRYGGRATTVPQKIKQGLFHGLCKQLGIDSKDV